MTDDPSPWPEARRTQYALFAAGGLLLAVALIGLALPDAVPLGGAHVVMVTFVASILLVYGLLGWGGQWVAATTPHERTDRGRPGDDTTDDDTADDTTDDTEVAEADTGDASENGGTDGDTDA